MLLLGETTHEQAMQLAYRLRKPPISYFCIFPGQRTLNLHETLLMVNICTSCMSFGCFVSVKWVTGIQNGIIHQDTRTEDHLCFFSSGKSLNRIFMTEQTKKTLLFSVLKIVFTWPSCSQDNP